MKIKHLLKAQEFVAVFKKGAKFRGRQIIVYVKETAPGTDPAIGVVISKKVAQKAVTRNFVKRLIYGYFRARKGQLIKSANIVVRIAEEIQGAGRRTLSISLREELDKLLLKAGIIR